MKIFISLEEDVTDRWMYASLCLPLVLFIYLLLSFQVNSLTFPPLVLGQAYGVFVAAITMLSRNRWRDAGLNDSVPFYFLIASFSGFVFFFVNFVLYKIAFYVIVVLFFLSFSFSSESFDNEYGERVSHPFGKKIILYFLSVVCLFFWIKVLILSSALKA